MGVAESPAFPYNSRLIREVHQERTGFRCAARLRVNCITPRSLTLPLVATVEAPTMQGGVTHARSTFAG